LEKKVNKPLRDKALWDEALKNSSIIAAVRSEETLESALDSPVRLVYLLFGNPMNLAQMIAATVARKKLLLVNADLLQGFSRDAFAVEYLAHLGVSGVISTHHGTLQTARTYGLITVLRTFMIDSAAVEGARRFLANFQPDAVELLPAIAAPLVIDRFRESHPSLKVIAGGLISNLMQVDALVKAGVDAVSLSRPELWVL
jgi:glycerol uptake operon antiterminator